ncbi:MAG TPA: c-type cytochrome [Gammaproteobacteria bacterium]|nr:c-type cytochrome [Gammaproteobacteria bacterium]
MIRKLRHLVMNTMVGLVIILISSTSSVFSMSGDPQLGQSKALFCSTCHGQDGNSTNPAWPSLASQHMKYTVTALQNYQNGSRENVVMQAQVMALSKEDFEDLAAYYNTQKTVKKEFDYDLAKQGESLYRGGNSKSGVAACIACHGPTGRGNPGAGYPSIAGQHAAYTAIALKSYANGERKAGLNDMMQALSSRLTDEEIQAVSEYIQALASP